MKRLLIIFILLVLVTTACNGSSSSSLNNNNEEEIENKIVLGTFTEDDLTFTVGGKTFFLNSDVEVLLEEIGEDYTFSEAPSCVYDGTDKTYEYESIAIYTYPNGHKDIIDEIILLDSRFSTKKGIKVGSTTEDVIEAYGEQYIKEGEIITYSLSSDADNLKSPRLYFVLKDETVVSISYYSASNIK